MRVLVVDDSAVVRSLLLKYLEELGVTEVDQAPDGEVALALVLKRAYDLILLDWMMPKKTGLEVLQVIRARGNKVPVMMITTEAGRSVVLQAIKAGVTDYVFKPFAKETVVSKLRKLLPGSG